ncbi:MAG: hypothetical protein OEV92_05710 [Nitrospinota bacterium]|nr:hypothetical protein [Nitrospinota bacterium]
MSLRSIYTLRRAASLARKGRTDDAAARLRSAIDKKDQDPRLAIRLALVSDDYAALAKAADEGQASRAAHLFLALGKLAKGNYKAGERHCKKALEAAPENLTAKALLALARFGGAGDASALVALAPALAHTSLRAQGLILLAAERAIVSANPSDTGAPEVEDVTGGPLAWVLDLLDDLAIWVYWLISIVMNLLINARDAESRAVYWHVIEGDRLEGLRKNGPAVERFKKALELRPGCIEALESMVKHQILLGQYQEAEATLALFVQAAGEGASDDPSVKKWQADIAFFLGRTQEAKALYQALDAQFPLSYIIPYRIGLCAMAGNELPLAAASFQRALGRINPGLIAERVKLLSSLGAGAGG